VAGLVDEHTDTFHFVNDLLALEIPFVTTVCARTLPMLAQHSYLSVCAHTA
jgi:hypothetical protein